MNSILNPLSIDAELADRLEKDEKFRRRYIQAWAQTEVASEIRRLRKERRLNQRQLAALMGTGQSAVSRIEGAAYDGWTFKTLIGIAQELKARLRITFERLEDVASGYRSGQSDNTSADVEHIELDSTDASGLIELGTTAGLIEQTGPLTADSASVIPVN